MQQQPPTRLAVVEKEPNTALIDYLQTLLGEAQRGELQGVAVACEWKDGSVGEGWCVSGAQRYRMLGALAVLQHKLARMEAD